MGSFILGFGLFFTRFNLAQLPISLRSFLWAQAGWAYTGRFATQNRSIFDWLAGEARYTTSYSGAISDKKEAFKELSEAKLLESWRLVWNSEAITILLQQNENGSKNEARIPL